jgi:hypothetical protein
MYKGMFYLVVSLLGVTSLDSVRAAGLVTFVEVQQQAGLDLGYRINAADKTALSKSDPQTPHGYGDANLEASGTRYGASGKAILVSRFGPHKLTAKGAAEVDSAWRDAPRGADNTSTQAASLFLSRFRTGDLPVTLTINGLAGVGLTEDRGFQPERTALHLRLGTGSGRLFWEEKLGAAQVPALKAVVYYQTLVPREEYCLAAYAEAGMFSNPEHAEAKSRAAWFDLNVSLAAIPAAEAHTSSAVLVVVTPELNILKVDDKPTNPSCVTERDGFREYTLPQGEHVILASFCSLRPAAKWTATQIAGSPLACRSFFIGGYDYVAVYRMQSSAPPESLGSAEETPTAARQPRDARWSVEVVNLVDARRWLSIKAATNPASTALAQRGQPTTDSTRAEGIAAPSVRDGYHAVPEVIEAIRWRSFAGKREAYVKQAEPNAVHPPAAPGPTNSPK